MTIVRIGRKGSNTYMEFEFEDEFSAYVFYSATKDHYREDDLFISMVEEEDECMKDLLNKGIMVKISKKELEEVCHCADCKNFKLYEEDGEWKHICEAHDLEVSGDFYCAWGVLNKKEEEVF